MTTPDMLSGRYRLGRVLGRGGMGTVHEAHDEVLDRDVAVKLLHVDQASSESVERFRREARILAGLSHPNIVTVYDFGVDGDRAWLVMRLLPGPTLQTLLQKRGRLPVDAAERYTREAASALAAAHAAGIVHRDIKPGNLMLGADGSCTLVDLGIARLAGSAEAETGLTQPGMMLGTVHYLAPEVITGGTPTPASDIYALGGVLFLMLTGRTPFAGADTVSALGQHVHAPVPGLRQLRPDIPPGLERLCQAMLAKAPEQRPSATQVAAALGTEAPARAAGAAGAAAAAAAAAAAGATRAMPPAAAAGSTRAAAVPPTLARPPVPVDDEDPHSARGWVIAACLALVVIVAAVLWLLFASAKKSPSDPTTSSSHRSTPAAPTTTHSTAATTPTAPSTQPSTSASDTPAPSDTAPSTPPSSAQDTPTDTQSTQQTLQQELADIQSALQDAVSNGSLNPAQKGRLDHSYNQLDQAVQNYNGNTDQTSHRLSALDDDVSSLHDNGAITDDDFNRVNEATGTMQGTLDNS